MYTVNEEMGTEQAYRVLGVPRDASAHAIKQAYRKLVKRWHPDLYKAGTAEHSEAMEMARLINEAYSAVSHAPLRYQTSFPSTTHHRTEWRTTTATTNVAASNVRPARMDRLEFWLRFAFGGALGILMGLDAALSNWSNSTEVSMPLWLAGTSILAVVFGFGSARYGDRFWGSVFRTWLEP